jgi:quercetin 2,3-dioxygenase
LLPGHEHVLFVALGSATAAGATLAPGTLLYLGTGHESLTLAAAEGSRVFLLGGEPLGEPVLMWWNFVGRTVDDIAAAAADWDHGIRFGKVTGSAGEPIPAPPFDPARLARPRLSQ